MKIFYPVFGAAVLAAMTFCVFFGWSGIDVDEVPKTPKSVRNNPGAYRSHYESHHIHTYRGK